jgi:hypothetical protein
MRFLECEIFGLIIVIVILLIYFFEIIGLTIGALLILFSIAMKVKKKSYQDGILFLVYHIVCGLFSRFDL